MVYKLIKDNLTNEISTVQRLADNAFIPFHESNTDYQEYLEWTKASPMNVAEPVNEVTE